MLGLVLIFVGLTRFSLLQFGSIANLCTNEPTHPPPLYHLYFHPNRRWLAAPTWEAERELWTRICGECRVIFTPGESCHAIEPGFFRVCFGWVTAQGLVEATRRVSKLLRSIDATQS